MGVPEGASRQVPARQGKNVLHMTSSSYHSWSTVSSMPIRWHERRGKMPKEKTYVGRTKTCWIKEQSSTRSMVGRAMALCLLYLIPYLATCSN